MIVIFKNKKTGQYFDSDSYCVEIDSNASDSKTSSEWKNNCKKIDVINIYDASKYDTSSPGYQWCISELCVDYEEKIYIQEERNLKLNKIGKNS